MNGKNNMDNSNNIGCRNVQLELQTIKQIDTTGKGVSATDSLTVADTPTKWLKLLFWCLLTTLTVLVLMFCGKVNSYASELNVYVDDTYMSENFGQYKNYAILTDGLGNYVTIYSESDIGVSTSTFNIYSFNNSTIMGYKTMKTVDGVLYVDDNGASNFNKFTVSQTYKFLGVDTSFNDILYSNIDVKAIKWVSGVPQISDEIVHSVADNIGSKPVDEPTEPTPTPDITVDCKFTDVNILEKLETIEANTMEKLETINTSMVAKIDILITLILVMIAIRMFSPLANNHKRGLDKKEK